MTAKKNKSSFTTTLVRLVLLGTSFFSFINNLSALIKFKARKAGIDLFTLLVLSCFIITLLLSICLCLQGLLLLYFISLQWTMLFSVSILLLINVAMFFIVGFIMCKVKNNLLATLGVD